MTVLTTHHATYDTAAMIDANLELSRRFFSAVFDDPSLLDDLPQGATLVLIPIDDPDLARANLVAAEREVSLGKQVVLRIVGAPPVERLEWQSTQVDQLVYKSLRPHWPEHPEQVHPVLHYFQDTDTLLIQFFDRARSSLPVAWLGPTFLLVDPTTEDVVGYLMPRFTGAILKEAPHFATWLRQANLHQQTPNDVQLLLADVAPDSPSDPTLEDVREEIGDVKLAG